MSKLNLIMNTPPEKLIKTITSNDGQVLNILEQKEEWLDDQTYRNKDGSLSSTDPNMVIREFYNGGNEDVTFTKQFPHLIGHEKIIVKPDQFEMIPHAYYIASTKSGRDIIGKWFFGNDMFKHERSKIR